MSTVKLSEAGLGQIESGRKRLEGLLLGQGNLNQGGECWLVPDWESREYEATRLLLGPDDLLLTLLDHLEAFGGSDYVLKYPAEVEGDVHRLEDGRLRIRAYQIHVTDDDEEIHIDVE